MSSSNFVYVNVKRNCSEVITLKTSARWTAGRRIAGPRGRQIRHLSEAYDWPLNGILTVHDMAGEVTVSE
jgi:hypothetical protein